jgi:hypothetical protein
MFAKAGVMLGGLTPTSARVILDVKPDGGVEFMARLADGSAMSYLSGAAVSFPVYLRLTRNGDRIDGYTSADAGAWRPVGSVHLTLPSPVPGGLAVTSHDPNNVNTATFDHVIGYSPGENLIINGGFEVSSIPSLGPGWVSDAIRQSPAQSETAEPHDLGLKNGACRTTVSLDCGIYQDVVVPAAGTYTITIWANASRPGAFVGANVNGTLAGSSSVPVGGTGVYTRSVIARAFAAGDTVRVWLYSPASPGSAVIDDVSMIRQQ